MNLQAACHTCWPLGVCVLLASCAQHSAQNEAFKKPGAAAIGNSAIEMPAGAKVSGPYKNLTAEEQSLVQKAVNQRLKEMIAVEFKRLAPKYEREREMIQLFSPMSTSISIGAAAAAEGGHGAAHARKGSSAKGGALAGVIGANRQEQLLRESRERQMQEALRNVQRTQAGSFAAGCVTSKNESVLAFAYVNQRGDIRVQTAAMKVDRPVSEIREGKWILGQSGEKLYFLATNPILISPR